MAGALTLGSLGLLAALAVIVAVYAFVFAATYAGYL